MVWGAHISETDHSLNLGLARSVAPMFRTGSNDVGRMITEVVHAISSWQKIAEKIGIPKKRLE